MQRPLVAIVILNWNGRHFLEKFLPSVIASQWNPLQVVVADNASTDDSVSFIRQRYPQVHLLENPINEGFAQGYNTALQHVKADYYILLNSDVEVDPDWIEPVITLMESNLQIAACQPKVMSYTDRSRFEYAGAAGGWIDSLGYPFCRGRIFDTTEIDEGQYSNALPVMWATGAAMFIRSEVFHAVNGFDPYFFAHMEEIDLCWRLQRMGHEIWYCPDSVVYHVGGGTLPKGNPRKTYLNYRNNLIMLSRNFRLYETVWKLPLRILLDWVSALMFLIRGNSGDFKAVLKAQWAWLGWLFSGNRHWGRGLSRKHQIKGMYRGSVVWQYFVRGKKSFLEIMGTKK